MENEHPLSYYDSSGLYGDNPSTMKAHDWAYKEPIIEVDPPAPTPKPKTKEKPQRWYKTKTMRCCTQEEIEDEKQMYEGSGIKHECYEWPAYIFDKLDMENYLILLEMFKHYDHIDVDYCDGGLVIQYKTESDDENQYSAAIILDKKVLKTNKKMKKIMQDLDLI